MLGPPGAAKTAIDHKETPAESIYTKRHKEKEQQAYTYTTEVKPSYSPRNPIYIKIKRNVHDSEHPYKYVSTSKPKRIIKTDLSIKRKSLLQ